MRRSLETAFLPLGENEECDVAGSDVEILAINNPYTVMKAIQGAIVEELWRQIYC